MYLSAIVRDDGIEYSVVEIPDDVWAANEADIRARMAARGFDAEVIAPAELLRFELERRCENIAAVFNWIALLNPETD